MIHLRLSADRKLLHTRCPCGSHNIDLALDEQHWQLVEEKNGTRTLHPAIACPCGLRIRLSGGMWLDASEPCAGAVNLQRLAAVAEVHKLFSKVKPVGMFGEPDPSPLDLGLPVPLWTAWDMAVAEREVLGTFASFHPYAGSAMFSSRDHMQMQHLLAWDDAHIPARGLLAVIDAVEVKQSRRGNTYARCEITDGELRTGLLIWPGTYKDCRQWVRRDQAVIIYGSVQGSQQEQQEDEAAAGLVLEVVADDIRPYC